MVIGVALPVFLGACAGFDRDAPSSADVRTPTYSLSGAVSPRGNLDPTKENLALVAAGVHAVSQRAATSAELGLGAAAAVVAYVVYDPLAPNWCIEERSLDRDTYFVSMQAKSFRTGGDGESGLILKRRAQQLQRDGGFSAYRILDYSEGIESSTPFTHRYASGVIQLVRSDSTRKPP
jgi:hypothetical protein